METPSSIMITRSQKAKQEGSRTNANAERSALVDVTNDSPIVGLATTGNLLENTPLSSAVKNTPGSGETLLRCQVRTLLQNVEEEGEFVNKLSSADPPSFPVFLDIPGQSPMQILDPTTANTLQNLNHAAVGDRDDEEEEEEEGLKIDPLQDEHAVNISPESLVNRALFFNSPGKSESSNAAASSSLTYQCSKISSCYPDGDNSSAWSLQVNDIEDGIEDFDEEEGGDECYDELCTGLGEMSVQEFGNAGLPEFMGKHSRFVYNSDDEIEKEEVIREKVSPDVLLLKGLPVPEGKHIRFQHEDEDAQ